MRGLERGLERAIGPINVAAYVEIEAFVIENLLQQMEQGLLAPAPVWSDLKTFPSEAFHNKIHGITGGYPCQPFSVAGKRHGTDDPRHLWPHILSIIRATLPLWTFFENVPGHLNIGYQEVRSDLQSLGYSVAEGLFSAHEIGAPHKRLRLFILAVDNACLNRLQQVNKIQAGGHGSQPPGQTLANPTILRMEGLQISKIQTAEALPGRNSRGDRWPAPPGQHQYPWEAPRLESSMGYAINGYNFREDLLRMAGNAVVEQAAQLAFNTLIKSIL